MTPHESQMLALASSVKDSFALLATAVSIAAIRFILCGS